jgi:uncharacterized repeat protein (TIGR01451 family)
MKNNRLGTSLWLAPVMQGMPKLGARFLATTCLSAALAISSVSASYAALSNTATATGTPAAGTLTDPSDTLNIPVQLSAPGYTVVKSVVSTTTSAGARPTLTDGGDTITYSYVVDNTGNVSLSGVALTDPGVSFNGGAANALTSGPTLASGDTDSDNVLDVNEVWTYTASYVLTQGNVDAAAGVTSGVSNTVSATANNPQGAPVPPTPGGSTLTATTTIPASPALTIDKTADTPGPLTVGQIVNYTYLVTNTGNVTISGVDVNETAFNGTGTPVPSPTTTGSTTLLPGDTVTFTASYTVTQADIDTLQ